MGYRVAEERNVLRSPVQLLTEFLTHTSDAAVITSLVAPDATYVSLSFDDPELARIMPWCGTHAHAGPRAIIETFADVARYWRVLELKPMHVFGDDGHAAAFGSFTYESSVLRKRVTSPFAVFVLAEAGRITYMQFMEDTFATAATFQESGTARYRRDLNGDVVELSVSPQSEIERNKAVAHAYYQAGIDGSLTRFAQYLDPDFAVTAPNYLPWGGTHKGAAFFADDVLPNLSEVFDFSRFSYDSVTAEDDRVAAIINIGVTSTNQVIKLLDLWTIRDGKVASLWVALFEPQALLDKLGITHGGAV